MLINGDFNLAQCEIFGDSEHSIITLEENEKPQLSIDHSYSATETSTADKKILKRLKICEALLQEKRKRNRALVQKVRNLKQQNAKMKQGNFSQNLKKKIASDVLQGTFSKAQISIMCSKGKKKFSHWGDDDYKKAYPLRMASSKAYKLVRSCHVPLPEISTLCRKFSFIHIIPGILRPIMLFLHKKCAFMSTKEKLSAICFDEMNMEVVGRRSVLE